MVNSSSSLVATLVQCTRIKKWKPNRRVSKGFVNLYGFNHQTHGYPIHPYTKQRVSHASDSPGRVYKSSTSTPNNRNSVYVYLIRGIHVHFNHQTVNQHFSYDKTDRVKKVRRNEKPWRHKPKKPKDGDLTSSMHRL